MSTSSGTSLSELPGLEQARELGLTDAEYEGIVDRLGRPPNEVELAMFSLMWSEHCGYKHSRRLLRRLPTDGPRIVLGPGENPNGSLADVAGVRNPAGNVVGLMPHPEHAADPLTGSVDGLKLLHSMADHVGGRLAA